MNPFENLPPQNRTYKLTAEQVKAAVAKWTGKETGRNSKKLK